MTRPSAAMIFAAGFGTRMAELGQDLPKPMVPVAGRPMIDHTIDLVRDAGIKTIVANTHHMHDQMAPHLLSKGVEISHEADDILNTGGGLRDALSLLGDGPVLTINPDALWIGPNPLTALLSGWQSSMHALLLLVPLTRTHGSAAAGDFSLKQGEIRRNGHYRYGGAQIIRTDLLGEISEHAFSLNTYWDLLADRHAVHGLVYQGEWCDIGHPEGLRIAEKILSDV